MSLAVVVPVLRDAGPLLHCLGDLLDASPDLEVTVVDGDTDPICRKIAVDLGARYLESAPGRGIQQNAGAAASGADWIWFLHADSHVPPACVQSLERHCSEAPPGWGCFHHRIDHGNPLMRVIESSANLRARLGLPYGDQGIFVERRLFESKGGFPEEPFLEDMLLAKKLRSHSKPRVLVPPITTSARRWKQLGIARTTWRNWRILALHLAGSQDLKRMAAIYAGRRVS